MRPEHPHPHDQKAKDALAKADALAAKVAADQRVDDTKLLMSTLEGRREACELLRQGFHLPGQIISNTNGSLQSYQLGRFDCMRELDERIRQHCNEEWLLMLTENEQ